MVSTPAAEWLIARFTDPDKAIAIVGDLLEEVPERGALWFWLSVADIALRLNGRRLLAFACGAICLSSLRVLPMPLYAPLRGMPPASEPSESWRPLFEVLGLLAMQMWVAAPFLIVRYGGRDRFARLALAFSVPLTTAVICWRSPAVVVVSVAAAAAILAGSTVFTHWRRPLMGLAIAALIGYGSFQGAAYLAACFLNFAPPSVGLAVCANDLVPLCAAATLTIACGWMRSFLTRQSDPDGRTENET